MTRFSSAPGPVKTSARLGLLVLAPLVLATIVPVGAGAAAPPAGVPPQGSAAGSAAGTPAGTVQAARPVVTTHRGAVRGVRAARVEAFLGIPYAAAPTGERRWRAPAPAPRWHGVRDAGALGHPCPVLPSSNGPRSETEDCLDVNVWRPAGTTKRDRLPVHVFIHGGGLVNGTSAQNDETRLVRRTGVIGVSLNYRLGVFGFLRTPGLAAETPDAGNYGFLDQQAALRWVKRNIRAFGGAPRRVTIDGESAGGWSVCGHLTSPGSRGLFSRAMIQSGSCSSQTPARAVERGDAYLQAVGCTDPATEVSCLRAASAADVLDASADYVNANAARFVSRTPSFPRAPAAALAAGRFRHVPVVVGANRDEGRTFAAGYIGTDRAAYEAFVTGVFGDRADDVLAHYPWPADSDQFTAAYLVGAIQTDAGLLAGIGGCTNLRFTRQLSRATRTYAYEFAHRNGPGLTQIPGYVWGAGHAAELAYIWPSFDNGVPIAPLFDAGERRLSRQMTRAWGAFTRSGHPRLGGGDSWPQFRAAGRPGRIESLRAGGHSRTITAAAYAREHQCGFWATMPRIDLTS